MSQGSAALESIARMTASAPDPASALAQHQNTARRGGRPTFRVIVRKAGQHAFRRLDAQRACEQAFRQRYRRWRLVEDDAAMEFWLQIIDDAAILALRLSSADLHQRTYREASLPGALKPTIAHALIRLADPRAGGLLIDPMCGTATVLAEAALAGLSVVGGDVDPRAARLARRNLRAVRAEGCVALWDARCLPLGDAAAAAVACNLPWGKQHGEADLPGLYRSVLSEAQRVVRHDGRIVLLTANAGVLTPLLRRQRDLVTERTLNVVVRGADASLFVVRKAR
ncbi:MAG: THUMP domain-containing class I SAM-dependent methyltransferase [Dehalococcoidia bacterium]